MKNYLEMLSLGSLIALVSLPNAYAGHSSGPRTCNTLTDCFTTSTETCGKTSTLSRPTNAVLSDNQALFSDSMGIYVNGIAYTVSSANTWEGLRTNVNANSRKATRSMNFDLSNPVPGGGGVSLGVINDWQGEIHVHWQTVDNIQYNLNDIPIGDTVLADSVHLGVHVNGVIHVLQAGPVPKGACRDGATAINGDGTTQVSIYRADANTWEVDAPAGSIGRLWDDHYTDQFAVDRGLYYFSFHLQLKAQ